MQWISQRSTKRIQNHHKRIHKLLPLLLTDLIPILPRIRARGDLVVAVRYTVPPPSTHSLTHSEDYHMVATYICYKTLGCARHREQETTTKSSREKKKAVKHERHKAQGLTDLYLTAVPSERSTAVTCGQYSSRYVSATGCEEEETTTRRPKEKKKKKKKHKLPETPSQDCHSKTTRVWEKK